MAKDKQIVLITGGNSGIGFSLASLLIADESKHVIITSRSIEKGEAALKELQAMQQPGSVEMLQVEMSDPKSISTLVKKLDEKHGRLDALVNNAAVARVAPGTSLFDHMQQCFAVNASGPAVLIEEALPLLQNSTQTPRIINVSSGAGSFGITLDPNFPQGPLFIPYKASKAALNMVSTVQVAKGRVSGSNIKIFTYCPGFRVSNLGPYNKAENGAGATEGGSRPMVAMLNGEKDDEHAGYLNSDGGQHPW